MGLFGSNKKTYVSSVVYNMAGDEFKRPNYLQTIIVSAIINGAPSAAESITGSYLNGPGMRFRRFNKWAHTSGYNSLIGFVTGRVETGNSVDNVALLAELPVTAGYVADLQSVLVSLADYTYWADQYVLENFPTLINTAYVTDIDEGTDLITITWEDTTTTSFTPAGYDKYSQYLHVVYLETGGGPAATKIFIYKRFSGNTTLDGMFQPTADMPGFYPVIPVRLDNKFVSKSYLPLVYEQAKRGYKKATTGRLDKLIENLEDNDDLADIDYAYIVFGVSLNVLEQTSRKYIFKFFEEILNDYTTSGSSEYSSWQTEWYAAKASWDAWFVWKAAQDVPADPLYGTPAPARLMYPVAPGNSVRVSTGSNPTINYDMTISWTNIEETSGTGLLKPTADTDQLWFTTGTTDTFEQVIAGEGGTPIEGSTTTNSVVILNWQVTKNTWRRLKITGLKHVNLIYGGKSVEIDALDALEDPEESGFIIPLHDGIYRAMGLKDGTQMATACVFLVLNCYTVVKKKWYQTTLFKIILVVIILVIAFYTGYLDLNTMGGVLGTNASVGAGLGFATGSVAALVAGAVANAIAAIIITRIVTAGATELFGEKYGAIIGAIVSIIALQVGTSVASGGSMSTGFSGMMKAENLITLSSAVGDGYAGYIRAANNEIMTEQANVMANYQKESRAIRTAWEENLGGGNGGIIDPMTLTSAFGVTMEQMDSFLQRTLMTGSDISGMSMDMLSDFVRLTLSTELPT